MSDRAKKSIGQDVVGALFCLLGGFFGVSLVLHLFGQEPVVGFATRPVLELVALVGPVAALLLSFGVAALGAWIFLSATAPAVGRPLAALALASACVALIAGAWAYGGGLGDVFPGLVSGMPGRLIGAVLGVVVGWLALTLLPQRSSGTSTADVMRAGLGSRGDLASGVSAAEAALLVSDSRPSARPAPKREEPVRQEILRPIPPEAKPRPIAPVALAAPVAVPARNQSELPAPAAPAWESDEPDAETAPEDEEERELAAELAEALSEDEEELEPDELARDEEKEPAAAAAQAAEPAAANPPPPASWEQVSLFDEEVEEPVEEEPAPVQPAAVTPTFAFEEPPAPRHEPERATADDPFAAEPVTPPARVEPVAAAVEAEEVDEELEVDGEELEDELEAELEAEETEEADAEPVEELVAKAAPALAPAPAPAPKPEFVLQPKPAPRPEPLVERDGERERWEKLVFDSGALIVEQKRVAVSMLERRFGIDFDTACKVLDELQQVGLIGPYIGGRTREILLTSEQWLAQAPQTA